MQIGIDSPDAVLLSGVGADLDWVFPMLDGAHSRRLIARTCSAQGSDLLVLSQLLKLLADAGLLLEGGRSGHLVTSGPAASRVRLVGAGAMGSSIAALLINSGLDALYVADSDPVDPATYPDAGAASSNGAALAARLTGGADDRAGPWVSLVNHWSKPDGVRPDLTVVAAEVWECDRVVAEGLVRADQPHLLVRVRGAGVVVGPLVVPGRTACLRCTDLTRTAADPAWPALLRQLCRLRSRADPAVLAWGAATAVTQVLAYLAAATPETYSATLELDAADYVTRRRVWTAHPACGCGWGMTAEWGA